MRGRNTDTLTNLEAAHQPFELPTTHVDVDDTWQACVDPYIIESKRLITVRRNNIRFKYLQDLRVDLVEQKGGIRIRLGDYELDMSPNEALTRYAVRHEELCTDFVRAVLDQSERPDLKEKAGPNQKEFVEYLESGVVERDLEELF